MFTATQNKFIKMVQAYNPDAWFKPAEEFQTGRRGLWTDASSLCVEYFSGMEAADLRRALDACGLWYEFFDSETVFVYNY